MHVPTPATEQPVLLSSADLSRMLGISRRHVCRLRDSGRLPTPIRLGKLIRWRKVTIETWLVDCDKPLR